MAAVSASAPAVHPQHRGIQIDQPQQHADQQQGQTGRVLISLEPTCEVTLRLLAPPTRRLMLLHVGTVKTGSTSLQAYLSQHQQVLAEAGWRYLSAPGRRIAGIWPPVASPSTTSATSCCG